MKGFFARVLKLGFALLLCSTSGQAADTPIPHGTLDLLSENQWITPAHDFYLGLHFQLEKGWHTYWINPGDSGEAPRVTWHLPPGFTPGAIEWPTPERLGTGSVVDFGYEDAVTLIVPLHAQAGFTAQQPVRIGAEVRVLVCREMCTPGKAQVSLTLPVRAQPPVPDARTRELFAATRKSLPKPAPAGWRFRVDDAKDTFLLSANSGHQIKQAVFFPALESQVDNAAPQKLQPTPTGFRLTLRKSDQLLKPIERLKGVLVLSSNEAYLIDVPVGRPR
jgi:thiol:disulfide interchange protein DsbD